MIRSHLDFLACLMIASKGKSPVAATVSHLTPALLAAFFTGSRISFARAAALSSKSSFKVAITGIMKPSSWSRTSW
ncbi:hypothetical protein D3C83_109970 [compost metagenome]